MADWSKPTLSDQYVNFLTYMKALATDLAKGNDPAKVALTNPFADMIRFNSTGGLWEIYNGTTWGPLANSYNLNVTTLGGNAANLYALLANPVFSGTPQCPTADLAANNQLLANTAFVQLIKYGLIDSAPANLNTIGKLAASLGNDPAFATTSNNIWISHLGSSDPHGQYAFDSDLTTHAGVAASITVVGHTRLATNAETTTGTATNIATHPAGVAAAIAAAMNGVSSGGGISVFTANGTFTVPNGVTTIYVTAVAGGGGGGAKLASMGGAYGGGGGGGCIMWPLTVTPGQQLTITIGNGGLGGTSAGAIGGSGGSTSIGALLTLTGGAGGSTSTGGAGGIGPKGNGGWGQSSPGANVHGAFGGGGGGSDSNYRPGASGGGVAGPGASYPGVGMHGSNAVGYGGGGSGVSATNATVYYGGNGAPGIAIIEW